MGDMQLTMAEGQYKREKEQPLKWDRGLPTREELPPLNQTIISPILAGVFRIDERECPSFHSEEDVENASHHSFLTLQEGLRRKGGSFGGWDFFRKPGLVEPRRQDLSSKAAGDGGYAMIGMGNGGSFGTYRGYQSPRQRVPGFGGSPPPAQDEGRKQEWGNNMAAAAARTEGGGSGPAAEPPSLKRKADSNGNESKGQGGGVKHQQQQQQPRKSSDGDSEDGDSAGNGAQDDSGGGGYNNTLPRTLKRPRLVWTPQLHKRFVDAVGHLGIKHAVPKTIMQLMNVEGLTRENVASHLQKYRLYLKRMQASAGYANDAPPSASDMLFASTPIPPSIAGATEWHSSGREEGPMGYRGGGPDVVAQMPMQMPPPGAVALPTALGLRPAAQEGGFEGAQTQSMRNGHQMGGLGLGPLGPRNDAYGEGYDRVYEQQHGHHHHGDVLGGTHQRMAQQREATAAEDYDRSGESPSRKVLSLFPV